jgi:hypothetical protein
VVCLAPRALKDSVRPRRLSGVVVRPLNFTVRRPPRGACRVGLGRPQGDAVPGIPAGVIRELIVPTVTSA